MTVQTEAQRDADIRAVKRRAQWFGRVAFALLGVWTALETVGVDDLSMPLLTGALVTYGQGRYWHGWLDRAEEVRRDPA